MRGGSTEPARIVAGELFRSVTVKVYLKFQNHGLQSGRYFVGNGPKTAKKYDQMVPKNEPDSNGMADRIGEKYIIGCCGIRLQCITQNNF